MDARMSKTVGEIMLAVESEVFGQKPVLVPIFPPQILHPTNFLDFAKHLHKHSFNIYSWNIYN
jgi:hypothetical protein